MNARWKAVVLAALTTAFLALAGPALAAKTGKDATLSSASAPAVTAAAVQAGHDLVGAKATTQQDLSAYWTADRMRNAIDADSQPVLGAQASKIKAAQSTKSTATGPVGKFAPQQAATSSPALTAPRNLAYLPGYAYYSFPARTAGKVFFTNSVNHLNYVCSGTIVNSEGKDVVWTAGHCVHGGQGGLFHSNWVFVPSYQNGWAPYGTWSARQLWTMNSWMSSSDYASDMGAAVMNTNFGGWRIVDYLGGQGITWNQSKNITVTSFGYPQDAPFNGQLLWNCYGTTFPEWVVLFWSSETIGLPCDMTGGSSGGGWLAFFNGTTGYVDGHNDYKYNNNPNTMYSPYYDDTASSLFQSVRYL
jgi:hypothetical protein